jgi:hypothetical protein
MGIESRGAIATEPPVGPVALVSGVADPAWLGPLARVCGFGGPACTGPVARWRWAGGPGWGPLTGGNLDRTTCLRTALGKRPSPSGAPYLTRIITSRFTNADPIPSSNRMRYRPGGIAATGTLN